MSISLQEFAKIASAPLFFFLSVIILICLMGLIRFPRAMLWLLLVGTLTLWTASLPAVGKMLYGSLEDDYPPQTVRSLQPVDVIVVLGGGISPAFPPRKQPELENAADRVWHAARLYHAGKAKNIVVAGGATGGRTRRTEAANMVSFLTDLGVPYNSISIEASSTNTYENAKGVKQIWQANDFRSGYLVTSAGHMQRALGVFRNLRMDVTPAATDYRAVNTGNGLSDWLPQVSGLELTTNYVYEQLGLFVYKRRGWTS